MKDQIKNLAAVLDELRPFLRDVVPGLEHMLDGVIRDPSEFLRAPATLRAAAEDAGQAAADLGVDKVIGNAQPQAHVEQPAPARAEGGGHRGSRGLSGPSAARVDR